MEMETKCVRYVDASSAVACVSVFMSDAQIFQAGTTRYIMPASDKNAEYTRWKAEYDIRFFFEDDYEKEMGWPDFYAVPRFDVFARDSTGGYIGTVGQTSDLQSGAPIGYIDREGRCFLIAESGVEFVQEARRWREKLKPFDGLRLYASREAAEAELEFVDISCFDDEQD